MTDIDPAEANTTPPEATIAPSEARRAIEAIVMVSEEPADPRLLAQLIEISPGAVEEICHDLAAEYAAAGRGFVLARVAGGWRFQSHPELSPYVERFVLTGQSARLSAAALETLSIVAYKQPISRGQVAAIRGVNVDGVMRTLQQRGYIAELARDTGPGQAVLFGTTSRFLERLGLDSLDDLPPLGDFVPSATVIEALETGLRVDAAFKPDTAPEFEPDAEAVPDAVAVPEPEAEAHGELQIIDLTDNAAPLGLDALEVLADERDA